MAIFATVNPRLLIISNYSGPITPIRPEAEIVLRLRRLGFEITVLSPEGHYPKLMQEAGCTVIHHLPKNKFDHESIGLIRSIVRDQGIQVIHAFNSKAIANAAWAVWNNKAVKLVSYRGYTGNIHWYDPTLYLSYLSPRIDKMVCLAESVRETYLKNGVAPSRAITIHKGHDPQWYSEIPKASLAEFNLPEDAMVCTLVANHRIKMKGVLDVVNASALIPEDIAIHFLMIGDGLNPPEVFQEINRKGQDHRFTFTGYRKDASQIVHAGDVAISASTFGEATQKAVIEAMYLAKPMIITSISGNKGMVVNGDSGLVVPPSNPKALSEALLRYAQSPEFRASCGQRGRAHIEKFLSIDLSVEAYAQLYQSLVEA
jgi:glycosyltransferase involved in cell wall biosynthesis